MIYKTFIIALLTALSFLANSQTIVFEDDFESSDTNWILGSKDSLNLINKWSITSDTAISGSNSLAIVTSKNSGSSFYYGYNEIPTEIIAYHEIDASSNENMILNFKWYCTGEESFDYGYVVYSLNKTDWHILYNDNYPNGELCASTTTNEAYFELPDSTDYSTFYLGFVWINDDDYLSVSPLIIDDIKVMTDIPPIAGFTTTETTTFAGASIYFKNTAVFADSVVWYFEGAEPGFSSDSNPVNILYSQAGKYDVTQVAFNENGKDSIVYTDYIEVLICDGIPVKVEIMTDDYGYETSWEITNANGSFVYKSIGSNTYENNSQYVHYACLPYNSEFQFNVYDQFGDGIYSPGYFKLSYLCYNIKTGSTFNSFSETRFKTPHKNTSSSEFLSMHDWKGSEGIYDLIENCDGSYVACGATDSYTKDGIDGFIAQISSLGDTLWVSKSGGYGNESHIQIVQTHDGNYATIGEWADGDFVFIRKTAYNGALIWQKIIGEFDLSYNAINIIEDTDSNLYILYTYYDYNDDVNIPVISKFSVDGDSIWTTEFTDYDLDINTSWSNIFTEYLKIDDYNNIYLTARDPFDYSPFLTMLDTSGSIIWEVNNSDYAFFSPTEININSQGNILQTLDAYSYFVYDEFGDTIGYKEFNHINSVYETKALSDGRFVSLVDYFDENYNFFYELLYLSPQGDSLKAFKIINKKLNKAEIHSFIPTSDGGFLIAGLIENERTQDNFLMKIDSNGNGCFSKPFQDQEICLVTVDDSLGNNLITWSKHQGNGTASYNIYKETDQANIYELIGSVAQNEPAIFIDTNSQPRVRSNRYKIGVVDTCGKESELSNHHKTIHLTANRGIAGEVNLIWSHYEGFDFETYKIFRGQSPDNLEIVASIPSNLNSYSDINPPQGLLFYQIVVVKKDTCYPESFRAQTTSGPFSQSLSNIKDFDVFQSPYFSHDPEYVFLEKASDNTARINVYTNLKNWKVNTNESWIEIAEVNMDKNYIIIKTKSFEDERVGSVIISDSEIEDQYIYVYQGQKPSEIKETEKNEEVVIFPNPARDRLNILLNGQKYQTIEIFNLQGKQVHFELVDSRPNMIIDLKGFEKGYYIIRFTGNVVETRKLIVE